MVAADFDAYTAAQRRVDERWSDRAGWNAAAVRNVAHMGWFSSDRTIREYCEDIWKLPLGDRQPQPQRSSLQKSTVKVEGDGRGERARCAARHTLCNPHLEEISIAHRPVVIRTIDRD